ncbi:MAG: hypothetical protein IJH63_15350 [Methanobrevibacter sp.]|nr:hypothetical protein [Methanobrevibacter sp.]
MANKKNVKEVKETKPEVKEEKPKTIKLGTKVIVNGRTFGSHTLEAPMKTLRNVESKIIGISEDSYEVKEGFVSKDSVTIK